MLEHPENAVADPDLDELLLHFDQRSLDLILVEGFRDYPFAKIELYRATGQVPVYHPHDSRVVAVATDVEGLTVDIPVLDINNPWAVADFVQAYLDKIRHAS
jgi:molybdopterin-guanine dinucleotide biosynthesis protein MobB